FLSRFSRSEHHPPTSPLPHHGPRSAAEWEGRAELFLEDHMPWEHRSNRQYYYRKRRCGDRVISDYVGPGFVGDLAARLDALSRAERRAERQALRRDRDRERAFDAQLDAVEDALHVLVTAVLIAAGCRQHK